MIQTVPFSVIKNDPEFAINTLEKELAGYIPELAKRIGGGAKAIQEIPEVSVKNVTTEFELELGLQFFEAVCVITYDNDPHS